MNVNERGLGISILEDSAWKLPGMSDVSYSCTDQSTDAVIRNSLQLILTTSHTFHFISSCCIWNRLRAFDFEVFIDIVHVLYWF